MNKKSILLLLFASLVGSKIIHAQLVNKELCKKFSSGVISKLYKIAKEVTLTYDEQNLLARHFQLSDDMLMEAIQKNIPQAKIDSIEKLNENRLMQLLTLKQKKEYTSKLAIKFANTINIPQLQGIKKNFLPDSIIFQKLKDVYYNKYKNIYQQYLLHQNDQIRLTESMSKISSYYDSTAYSMFSSLFMAKSVSEYLKKIQIIKPVADSTLQKIKNIFYAKYTRNNYVDYNTLLLEATQYVLPDTTIFTHLHKDNLEKQASYLSTTERSNLKYTHHISNDAFIPIGNLIKEKCFQQALLQTTYAFYPLLCDSMIYKSNSIYNSKIETLLLLNGSLLPYSQFAIALKYRKFLDLRKSLADTLVQYALIENRKKDSILLVDPFAKIDFKVYEAEQLNKLLTEIEYIKLLNIKNRSQVIADSNADWDELEKRGLANSLNKDSSINQLQSYYAAKWNVYYRMANDKLKQEGNLRLLKENQPRILKILNAAQKQVNPTNENTTLKLKW